MTQKPVKMCENVVTLEGGILWMSQKDIGKRKVMKIKLKNLI